MLTAQTMSALTHGSRRAIERVTDRFEPYSDFNFTSLYCWNTDDTTEFDFIRGNLVVRMPDYLTGDAVVSMLGDNDIDATLDALLSSVHELRFVPEPVVLAIRDRSSYVVEEDRMHFDYMYCLEDLVALRGEKYSGIRGRLNSFFRLHPAHTPIIFHSIDDGLRLEIFDVAREWALAKGLSSQDALNELRAIGRFLTHANDLQFVGVGVRIGGRLAGFSLNEVLNDRTNSICHLQKALPEYRHVDAFLTHSSSKLLRDQGCLRVNWEQDLDLSGLRRMKLAYRPDRYLRKYRVYAAS